MKMIPTKSAYELTHETSKVLPQDRYVLSVPYYYLFKQFKNQLKAKQTKP